MVIKLLIKLFTIAALTIALVSCGGETRQLSTEEIVYKPRDAARLGQMKDGDRFLADLFKTKGNEDESFSSVSIKSPLWKASLEVLSSFPLSSVDSKSGLIVTDWYTSEKKPSERFKITVREIEIIKNFLPTPD